MNLLFIQGGSRWKYDSEGTLYTDPNFNSQIWSRYKGYCDELTVVLRREDRIYTKEEARIKFNEIGNSIDHCVALPDMYRPLSNALSCQKRMLVKRTIESEVKKADKLEKLAQYATRVWHITEGANEEKADKAIAKTREFFESLGVSTHLKDYGLGEEAVDKIVKQLEDHGMTQLGENGDVTPEVAREILTRAL